MFWKNKPKIKSISEISAENQERYKSFLGSLGWDSLGSKPDLLLVFVDQEGNNYYVAKNSWQGVSRDRLAALEDATLAIEHRYSRYEIVSKMESILAGFQRCQKGDLEAAHLGYKEAWEIMAVMKASPSEEVLMQYAVNIIYTDGENPELLDPEILKMKRARAEGDTALKAFFLNMALNIVNSSFPALQQDIQSSSDQAADPTSKKEASQNRIKNFLQTAKQKKK